MAKAPPIDLVKKIVENDLGIAPTAEEGESTTPSEAPSTPEAPTSPEPDEAPREPDAKTEEKPKDEEAISERTHKRIQKLLDERKAAQKTADSLREELAELKSEVSEARRARSVEEAFKEENLPPGFYDMPEPQRLSWIANKVISTQSSGDEIAELRKEIAELKRGQTIDREYSDLSYEQRLVAQEVAEAHPSLSSSQVRALAAAENPDLFGGDSTSSETLSPSHQVQTPRRKAQQKPGPDRKRDAQGKFLEAAKKRDRYGMHQAGVDLVKAHILKR